ncbi:MAG: DNA-directed RNA polymerase subunit alpha [Christensenellaceae bacterium]|jgi:DNA-directed RNA polymerase subunit alpha|nr:DNA-directed RNA polymerase subunit alpha [Christensenellaceae bacterium]
MVNIQFAKPKATLRESVTGKMVTLVYEPLERGYGVTIGNMIRRVALGNLSGTAVSAIRVDGVNSEFAIVKGVVEDMTDIVLNVKGLVLKTSNNDPNFTTTIRINKKTAGVVTARDIEHSSEISIMNPDLVIATVDSAAGFKMEMVVTSGKGYVAASEQKIPSKDFIAVDSSFSPVMKCNFFVEPSRVGNNMNYDKLTLEITTNGSVTGKEIVSLTAKLITEYLEILIGVADSVKNFSLTFMESEEEKTEETKRITIEEMELSPRSSNCLKRANIETVRDLTNKTRSEMLRVRNLGAKSLDEIINKLEGMNLSLKAEEEVI